MRVLISNFVFKILIITINAFIVLYTILKPFYCLLMPIIFIEDLGFRCLLVLLFILRLAMQPSFNKNSPITPNKN